LAAFRTGTAERIAGLRATDAHTLVLTLTRPVGDRLMPALTSLATAPVPPEFAGKFDRRTPPEYAANQIATGPYMIPADRLGKLTGVDAAKRAITLVRNPNWDAGTDFRRAYVDTITVRNVRDTGRAGRRVTEGKGLLGELPELVRSPDVHAKSAAGGRNGWDLGAAWIDAS
jgi:ABC-type transport system substrate-binding protein